MSAALLVVAGAVVGAPARWWVDRLVTARVTAGGRDAVLPWGTLTVNLVGSLVLGVVLGLAHAAPGREALTLAAGTGFCGAFTTFSTFAVETVRLAEEGCLRAAVANVVLGFVPGVGLAALGWWLGTR